MEALTTVLGVRFFTGDLNRLLERTAEGGLIVVPSAPVLTRIRDDAQHRAALFGADLAVTDSGLMVLLWFALKRQWLERISGLKYLVGLLDSGRLNEPGASFWIMPTQSQADENVRWLRTKRIPVEASNVYIAPKYPQGPLADEALLRQIDASKARYVIICLGGGVQERLGLYLRNSLSYRPALICTGAAIAFLSGQQVQIPTWADRLFLGWLFRTISSPRTFLPRYGDALRLIPTMIQYRERPPPLKQRG